MLAFRILGHAYIHTDTHAQSFDTQTHIYIDFSFVRISEIELSIELGEHHITIDVTQMAAICMKYTRTIENFNILLCFMRAKLLCALYFLYEVPKCTDQMRQQKNRDIRLKCD